MIHYYSAVKKTVKVSCEYWWPMKVSPPVTKQWFEGEDQVRIKPPSDTQVQTGHKQKLTQEAKISAGKCQRGSNMDLHAPKVDRTSSLHQQDDQTKCSSINKTSQKDEMMDLHTFIQHTRSCTICWRHD